MPLSILPNVLAGQDLTAALLSSQEVTAYKAADTSRQSVSTPAADPDMVIPCVANAIYRIEGFLVYNGAATGSGDLLVQVNAPTFASTFWWSAAGKDNSLTPILGSAQAAGTATFGTNGTGSQREGLIKGFLATSNAGSLVLLWSQNVSNSTATTMKAGSYLSVRRLA